MSRPWHRAGRPPDFRVQQTAGAGQRARRRLADFTAEQVLDTPFLLIGTIDEIAEQVRERRQRYGFSFITVHEPFMRDFAPVIERVRAG